MDWGCLPCYYHVPMPPSPITPVAATAPFPSAHPKPRARWLMVALCWSLYFSFGLTFGTISPLVTPIQEDLNMNSAQMGLVHGSWHVVYIFFAPIVGLLVDRLGLRKSLGLGAIIILISLITRGLSQNFIQLFLTVGLFGFGGPLVSVGSPKLVSVWFEGRERGIATGIYSTGPALGISLASATAKTVVEPLTGSWRGISLVYGILVALIVVAWILLAREPESRSSTSAQSAPRSLAMSEITGMLRLWNVKVILVLAMGTFVVHVGNSSWAPAILEEKGMTLETGGLLYALAIVIGIIGLVGIPGLVKHGRRALSMSVLLLLCTASAASMVFLPGAGAIASLIVLTTSAQPMLPMCSLLLMESPGVGAAKMGVAAGLFFAAAEVGGFFGPYVMGELRDSYMSLGPGFLMVATTAALLAPIVLLVRESRDP